MANKINGEFRFDQQDSRGLIGYTSGNETYDEKILKKIAAQQPDEKKFVDIYPVAEIKKDLVLKEEIKSRPEYHQERTPAAILGETETFRSIIRRDWFKGALAKKASEYDDLVHGTDIVAYLPDFDDPDSEEAMIPLAIDTTVTTQEETIDKKISRSLLRVCFDKRSPGNKGGRLTKLKYLRDDNGQPLKRTMNHYVIAMTPDKAKELGRDSLGIEIPPEVKLEIELQTLLAIRRQALVQIIITISTFNLWGRNRKIMENLEEAFHKDNGRQLETDILIDYLKENLSSLWANLKLDRQAPEMAVSLEENSKVLDYFDQLLKDKKASEENQTWFEEIYKDCFTLPERVTDLITLHPYRF